MDNKDTQSNDILRFEQLRRELIELEKRVQKSADNAQKEETYVANETLDSSVSSSPVSMPSGPASKKENVITKSVEKVKETTTVTAVGHAAILAFIQRYVPSMIPSTYAPERLDLLRQLEKVKEMGVAEGSSEEMVEAVSSRGDQVK